MHIAESALKTWKPKKLDDIFPTIPPDDSDILKRRLSNESSEDLTDSESVFAAYYRGMMVSIDPDEQLEQIDNILSTSKCMNPKFGISGMIAFQYCRHKVFLKLNIAPDAVVITSSNTISEQIVRLFKIVILALLRLFFSNKSFE